MKKTRIFNNEEINILLKNSNIDSIINQKQIVYNDSFKLWAVKEKLLHNEKTAKQIFMDGGFDMNILDSRTPQRRLKLWIEKYKKFGETYFNSSEYSTITLAKICEASNEKINN